MKYAAKSPDRFAAGLAKALDGNGAVRAAAGRARRANVADHEPVAAGRRAAHHDAL